ncbi:hypothetical protein CFP71_40455 [Amycolatopsis thailandensis]|uniref:Uncharacterized protein n=1 Tax=Amycolatopsis thailandensis TaxID=589330 RepID=A0A229RCH0_9PSEU|nr:hypothetical protein [Amycolatopsis thailandensis]OXM44337.1 hypothetical protein CFP71_40455 [Amycolatopsis thailandensis]
MGFNLQAVVATQVVLSKLAGNTDAAHVVPLGQQLSLLPMTDELFDAVTDADAPRLGGFWKMPAGFDRRLADCSASGPVAYLEAEYFGGVGTQSAQVWDKGRVVLGPLHLEENQPTPPGGSPISQALRLLGVGKGDHHDEFEAIGLGRHRDTDGWIDLPAKG